MDITQARGLVNEVEALLNSGSALDHFFRHLLNEIRASDVEGPVHEAYAKLNALGALDAELNDFISSFIRFQIKRFFDELYTTRRWHLINGGVYTYSDVLKFIEKTKPLIERLRIKIEEIHAESCKVSEEFSKRQSRALIPCGTGVLVQQTPDKVPPLISPIINLGL